MDAVAYIRVSTNKEEQELSLENQREFFEKYVGNRNDTLIRIYSDKGKSATKMKNRKDLQRLLSAARRGEFQRLYVKDISRLFRNTLDFITVSRELANLGVQLHLVNMGEGKDIDMFTLNLMAMIAERARYCSEFCFRLRQNRQIHSCTQSRRKPLGTENL